MTNEIINNTSKNGYQLILVNITWAKTPRSSFVKVSHKYEDLPSMLTVDLPASVLEQASKKNNVFDDVIESFSYNYLTNRFGYEVYHCQMYHDVPKLR
jgi:hypothetical protein